MKKKILALTLVFALALALGIGGTVAWLTAQTAPVVNTFTVGDINITLAESGATNNAKNYTFVPGDTLAKDPKVTVTAGSEACYLFVKVEEANNIVTVNGSTSKVINWSVDAGTDPASKWVPVSEHDGYWYREVASATSDSEFYVLTGGTTENLNGQVTVNENVTKEMVGALKKTPPTITVTAAAVQKDNVDDVAAAWDKLPTAFTGTP